MTNVFYDLNIDDFFKTIRILYRARESILSNDSFYLYKSIEMIPGDSLQINLQPELINVTNQMFNINFTVFKQKLKKF